MKRAWSGARGCASRVETASRSPGGDRSPRRWSRSRDAGKLESDGPSDATHSGVAVAGQGAERWCDGPDFGGAAARGGALPAGATTSGEPGECLLDAVGGEVVLAEVADLGASEPVRGANERASRPNLPTRTRDDAGTTNGRQRDPPRPHHDRLRR
jgi:hypothetical protein